MVQGEPQISKLSQSIKQVLQGHVSALASHLLGEFRNSKVGRLLWAFFNVEHIAEHSLVHLLTRLNDYKSSVTAGSKPSVHNRMTTKCSAHISIPCRHKTGNRRPLRKVLWGTESLCSRNLKGSNTLSAFYKGNNTGSSKRWTGYETDITYLNSTCFHRLKPSNKKL